MVTMLVDSRQPACQPTSRGSASAADLTCTHSRPLGSLLRSISFPPPPPPIPLSPKKTTGVRSIHQASRLAMAIKEGDKFPMDSTFQIKGDAGPADVPASEIFAGKKVVICGVPGAFTPTCDDDHLPSFIANADKFKEKGVDTVACMSVNDAFVMSRWIKSLDAEDKVTMLADGGAVFAEESGLCVKTGKFGGTRLQRLAMIVNDGTIEKLFLEDGTGYSDVSSGDTVLAAL